MAQTAVQLDRETFSCSICLDLLRDPVTVPCGHSYCMSCIKSHWDKENRTYRCPQCRQTFKPRPVLRKNTMLAVLVEKLKTELRAAPADHCYAGPEDVACDVCSGRKLKASKSCLSCLISFCETHLQLHYDLPAYAKHKLEEPSKKLQEIICPDHDEVMKMFCRTDHQSICYLCSMDQHKGHDMVVAAAERMEKQRELEVNQQKIQQRILDRERDVKLLQQEVDATDSSADKAVENSEETFTELIHLIEKRRSEVKHYVRSHQKSEVKRLKELQERMEKEIAELKRRDTELEKLSHTQDHIQFLQEYPSLSQLSESTASPATYTSPVRHLESVTTAVTEIKDELQDILEDNWTNISYSVTEVDNLLSSMEPETRAEFLKYARDITMDPTTVNNELSLSDDNRQITIFSEGSYYCHPDRFTELWQVLSKESLTGRCYWEVEWHGEELYVAVSYKDICRDGREEECHFGKNDKSWALFCYRTYSYGFWHNNVYTDIRADGSSRIGVYLDHSAGILSFYSVSEDDTMSLLHRCQTTFTKPLHAGLLIEFSYSYAAEFYKLID